jgi:hypothetical protein
MNYNEMYYTNSDLDILVRQKTADGWKMFAHEHPNNNTIINIIYMDGTEEKEINFNQKYLYKNGNVLGTCAICRFWKYSN